MDRVTARKRFANQKAGAKVRGIEWKLSFEQWLDWWGDDLDKRGQRSWSLQMQRVADAGAYELGNIRKGTPKDNGRTRSHVHQNNKAAESAALLAAARLDGPPDLADEPEEEDESISAYFSRDPGFPSNFRGDKWGRKHRVTR